MRIYPNPPEVVDMMKRSRLFPVVAVISLCFISGCSELYELREIKTMQDQRIQELENKNYNLKAEKEKEQIKYTGEIETLRKEITDLKEKRSEKEQKLADENFTLRRNLQTYTNQLDTAQTEIKKQKDEFTIFKSDSQSGLDQKVTDIKSLEVEKDTLIRENIESKSRMGKLEEQAVEKDNLRKKMEKQLADRDSLVSDLTTQLNDLKAQIKSVNSPMQRKTSSEKDADTSVTSLLDEVESRIQKDLSSDVKDNKINIYRNKRGLVIHLYSDDLFEKGTVIIGDDAKPLLLKISTFISQSPGLDIYVEGHTDNTPIENLPFLDNLALSSARADNILRFMVEDGSVDKRRARSVACSWFHPVASNDTPEGRRENRRVEIILQPQ